LTEGLVKSAMKTENAARRKKHVLIVDDNLDLAHSIKDALEAHDYEASIVPNGVLALKQLVLREVDAVLCDLKMPQLEGDVLYAAVKRIRPALGGRFIFITGEADDPKFQPFLSTVEAPVLQKPVSVHLLVKTLEQVLGQAS
jgi:DNA-binding NtrC family response regulator